MFVALLFISVRNYLQIIISEEIQLVEFLRVVTFKSIHWLQSVNNNFGINSASKYNRVTSSESLSSTARTSLW